MIKYTASVLSFLMILMITINSSAQNQYSKLWGKQGENWDKKRIPDFTTSGYRENKTAIPFYAVSVNVKDHGAAGDGVKDDTQAFRAAIRACGKKGTVFFPEGRYLITDSILIKKSELCIRGAGRDKTILMINKGLEQLYPKYGTRSSKQTPWSWSGAVILFQGDITDSGIEELGIQFPDSIWSDHDFHERAYNAVGFSGTAHNGWIRNITITGSDVGIWIDNGAHHITMDGWVLDFGPKRYNQRIQGHHGVNIYGGYNLLQNFEIQGKFWHDLSVESVNSTHNVFRNGKGTDLCMDHHHHKQHDNLFTNLDLGLGSRAYFSGGNDAPLGVSFNETYWNIRAARPIQYVDQYNNAQGHALNNVAVGIYTKQPSKLPDPDGNWFETIDPQKLYPTDLYQAQVELTKQRKK